MFIESINPPNRKLNKRGVGAETQTRLKARTQAAYSSHHCTPAPLPKFDFWSGTVALRGMSQQKRTNKGKKKRKERKGSGNVHALKGSRTLSHCCQFFTNTDRLSGQCVCCTPAVFIPSLVIFVNYVSVVCSDRGKKILFFKKNVYVRDYAPLGSRTPFIHLICFTAARCSYFGGCTAHHPCLNPCSSCLLDAAILTQSSYL
jgi:hypothetical protein